MTVTMRVMERRGLRTSSATERWAPHLARPWLHARPSRAAGGRRMARPAAPGRRRPLLWRWLLRLLARRPLSRGCVGGDAARRCRSSRGRSCRIGAPPGRADLGASHLRGRCRQLTHAQLGVLVLSARVVGACGGGRLGGGARGVCERIDSSTMPSSSEHSSNSSATSRGLPSTAGPRLRPTRHHRSSPPPRHRPLPRRRPPFACATRRVAARRHGRASA